MKNPSCGVLPYRQGLGGGLSISEGVAPGYSWLCLSGTGVHAGYLYCDYPPGTGVLVGSYFYHGFNGLDGFYGFYGAW